MMMAAKTYCKKHFGQELHKARDVKFACEGVMRGEQLGKAERLSLESVEQIDIVIHLDIFCHSKKHFDH